MTPNPERFTAPDGAILTAAEASRKVTNLSRWLSQAGDTRCREIIAVGGWQAVARNTALWRELAARATKGRRP